MGQVPSASSPAMNKDHYFFHGFPASGIVVCLGQSPRKKSRLFHEEVIMNRLLQKEWAGINEGREVVRHLGTGRAGSWYHP